MQADFFTKNLPVKQKTRSIRSLAGLMFFMVGGTGIEPVTPAV